MISSHAYDPEYLTIDHKHKICEPLSFAPIENKEHRYDRKNGDAPNVHTPQAQRCPRCMSLIAFGSSYHQHVFWCKRVDGGPP